MAAPHLYHAFGPGDITAVALVPGSPYVLEEITDFSISTHFDKIPIRRLGNRLPIGWATGSGTVAGTLICAQMTQGALWKLRKHAGAVMLYRDEPVEFRQGSNAAADRVVNRLELYASSVLPQQLPPFHLMFVHMNEAGHMAISRLYDVVISDQGETKGARNLFTEESLQYQASHYEQIRLHRRLTMEELQRLANRDVGFFNDIRNTETVAEGLATVAADFRSTAIDSGDVAGYLLSEAEGREQRTAEGLVTSAGVANQGDIVWVSTNGEPASGGNVVQITNRNDDTPARSLVTASLQQSYIAYDGQGLNTHTADTTAYLLDVGNGWDLIFADADALGAGGPLSLTSRQTLGRIIPGTSVDIPARPYYEALLQGTTHTYENIAYPPDSVRVHAEMNSSGVVSFTAKMIWNDSSELTADDDGRLTDTWRGFETDLIGGPTYTGEILGLPAPSGLALEDQFQIAAGGPVYVNFNSGNPLTVSLSSGTMDILVAAPVYEA